MKIGMKNEKSAEPTERKIAKSKPITVAIIVTSQHRPKIFNPLTHAYTLTKKNGKNVMPAGIIS